MSVVVSFDLKIMNVDLILKLFLEYCGGGTTVIHVKISQRFVLVFLRN